MFVTHVWVAIVIVPDMMQCLVDAMKQMEGNFAKQTKTLQQQNQAMQRKII